MVGYTLSLIIQTVDLMFHFLYLSRIKNVHIHLKINHGVCQIQTNNRFSFLTLSRLLISFSHGTTRKTGSSTSQQHNVIIINSKPPPIGQHFTEDPALLTCPYCATVATKITPPIRLPSHSLSIGCFASCCLCCIPCILISLRILSMSVLLVHRKLVYTVEWDKSKPAIKTIQ